MKIKKVLNKLTWFDLETTGKDINTAKIVSLYCDNKHRGWRINCLSNPETEISIEATKIHGIDSSMLIGKPTNKQVLAGLIKVWNDTGVIAGYNILNFDVPIVINICKAAGIPINYKNYLYVDVYKLVKIALDGETKEKIGSLRLESIYKFITGKEFNAHDAKADVKATKVVLKWLLKEYDISDCLYLNYEYIKGESVGLSYKFLSGKREGYTVEELLNIDPKYLKWMQSKGYIKLNPSIKLDKYV